MEPATASSRSTREIAADGRVAGALDGLLLGDAAGVPYEFTPPQAIPPFDEIHPEPPANFRSTALDGDGARRGRARRGLDGDTHRSTGTPLDGDARRGHPPTVGKI
jgi:hypothetical protein